MKHPNQFNGLFLSGDCHFSNFCKVLPQAKDIRAVITGPSSFYLENVSKPILDEKFDYRNDCSYWLNLPDGSRELTYEAIVLLIRKLQLVFLIHSNQVPYQEIIKMSEIINFDIDPEDAEILLDGFVKCNRITTPQYLDASGIELVFYDDSSHEIDTEHLLFLMHLAKFFTG